MVDQRDFKIQEATLISLIITLVHLFQIRVVEALVQKVEVVGTLDLEVVLLALCLVVMLASAALVPEVEVAEAEVQVALAKVEVA